MGSSEKTKSRERAYYLAHKEKIVARAKAHYLAHKKETAAWGKAYRLAHKEKIAATRKAYLLAHKKETAATKKAYSLAHKEKIAATTHVYYLAHKKETISAREKLKICSKCGGEKELAYSVFCIKCRNEYNNKYHHERKVRLWQGNIKTQKEELSHLRTLLALTKKAVRAGDREALLSLKRKFEQLQITAA